MLDDDESMLKKSLHILGRFPPPIDGQSLATQSLSNLLQQEYEIKQLSTTLPHRSMLPSGLSGFTRTVGHYLGLKHRIQTRLSDGHIVVWPSISGQSSGHWRDILTVIPCLTNQQPIIAVVHWGNFSRIFTDWKTAPTARRLVRRLNHIVVLSDELANRVSKWIPSHKLHVIPNYVLPLASKEQILTKRQDYSSSKHLRVLFLSHIMRQKGCYDLLQGLAIAQKLGISIKADFAGRWNQDGDEKHFHSKVQQLGLSNDVTVHGPIDDRSTVAELHRRAHAFVLPSVLSHEAQPLAIIEALSTATPLIITKRPVFEALVNVEQGATLVPSHDPNAIALALKSLTDDTVWLDQSKRAHHHYETIFSPDAVRNQWIKLIESVHHEDRP